MIELKQLTIGRELRDVDLVLQKGKIYGLLGPSGSGKNTLMKAIVGLVKPKAGKVLINNAPIGEETKKVVAYISSETSFYPYMTLEDVGEYFDYFYEDFSVDKYEKMIDKMNLYMGSQVKELSLEQETKHKVAVMLSRDAQLYILDEPFSGIDIIERDRILEAIREVANEEKTFIISSYLVDVLESLVDDVVFLNAGNVALKGAIEDIKVEHRKSIVELYKEIYA